MNTTEVPMCKAGKTLTLLLSTLNFFHLSFILIILLGCWSMYAQHELRLLTATVIAQQQTITNDEKLVTALIKPPIRPLPKDEETLEHCIYRKTNGRQRHNAIETLMITPSSGIGRDVIIKQQACEGIIKRNFDY